MHLYTITEIINIPGYKVAHKVWSTEERIELILEELAEEKFETVKALMQNSKHQCVSALIFILFFLNQTRNTKMVSTNKRVNPFASAMIGSFKWTP